MKQFFIISIIVFIISGCAPAGVKNVKNDYSRHETMQINKNYQAAYRVLARKFHECLGEHHNLSALTNLYHDIKLGELTTGNHFGTFLAIQVQAIDENNSKVDIFTGVSTWNRKIKTVKSWLDGSNTEC